MTQLKIIGLVSMGLTAAFVLQACGFSAITGPFNTDLSSSATHRDIASGETVPAGGVAVKGRSFAYRATSRPVKLRGVNWNRHTTRTRTDGQEEWWYSTFDAGKYNAAEAQRILGEIKASQYNYVRVFISGGDPDRGFGLSSPGVTATYVANIADFLNRAQGVGLYVVLTGQFEENQWLPRNYLSMANANPAPNTEGINRLTLDPNYTAALARFYQDLLTAIKAQPGDPLGAVFAIDIHNEIAVNKRAKPYSLSSGTYNFNGAGYNLSDSTQRQALIDNSTIKWIDTVASSIRAVDPRILIAPSVFTITATGNSGFNGASLSEGGDGRVALRPTAIARSSADYVDIHIYPTGSGYIFENDLSSDEIHQVTKPLIMGEVGVFKKDFPSRAQADGFLGPALARSCQVGFSGWGFWDWDSGGPGGPWALTEEGGAINAFFAPVANADLCVNTVRTVQKEGFFKLGGTIYYSNGNDAFCAKASWEDFLNTGGKADESNVDPVSALPNGMRNDGVCASPPQHEGFFKPGANAGIYYSNGNDAFCLKATWDDFLNSGGARDQANVAVIPALPRSMRNDGVCAYVPQPEGFFKTSESGGIYYSNGHDAFCLVSSWERFLASGGRSDQSNVRLLVDGLPRAGRNDGVCQ